MSERESLVVQPALARDPDVGRWLWIVEDNRRRLLEILDGLPEAHLDWRSRADESSIGSLLYHIALVELDWVCAEVLEQPYPPALAARFPHDVRDAAGRLSQVEGVPLAQHLDTLAAVRAFLLDTFRPMTLDDFRRARTLPAYDVTPEWVLYHLLEHEAEHRGQIGSLRDAAGVAVADG